MACAHVSRIASEEQMTRLLKRNLSGLLIKSYFGAPITDGDLLAEALSAFNNMVWFAKDDSLQEWLNVGLVAVLRSLIPSMRQWIQGLQAVSQPADSTPSNVNMGKMHVALGHFFAILSVLVDFSREDECACGLIEHDEVIFALECLSMPGLSLPIALIMGEFLSNAGPVMDEQFKATLDPYESLLQRILRCDTCFVCDEDAGNEGRRFLAVSVAAFLLGLPEAPSTLLLDVYTVIGSSIKPTFVEDVSRDISKDAIPKLLQSIRVTKLGCALLKQLGSTDPKQASPMEMEVDDSLEPEAAMDEQEFSDVDEDLDEDLIMAQVEETVQSVGHRECMSNYLKTGTPQVMLQLLCELSRALTAVASLYADLSEELEECAQTCSDAMGHFYDSLDSELWSMYHAVPEPGLDTVFGTVLTCLLTEGLILKPYRYVDAYLSLLWTVGRVGIDRHAHYACPPDRDSLLYQLMTAYGCLTGHSWTTRRMKVVSVIGVMASHPDLPNTVARDVGGFLMHLIQRSQEQRTVCNEREPMALSECVNAFLDLFGPDTHNHVFDGEPTWLSTLDRDCAPVLKQMKKSIDPRKPYPAPGNPYDMEGSVLRERMHDMYVNMVRFVRYKKSSTPSTPHGR